MSEDPERRHLFEYFIVAGLNEKEKLNEFPAQNSEGRCFDFDQKAPITDICIVFTSAGETIPPGYERIETTPSGYPANLNHGSLRSAASFICYKRGYHKPPLIDLGILDESRGEKAMRDAIVIDKTPYGLSANISNSSSQGLYFTIRRAQADAPPHQLVITDICVILENKGEHPPHTYYKIPKNLNRSMLGSEVYICYKKSQLVCKRIAYKPAVLDCFPRVRSTEDSILVQNVPKFFLPLGATIEAWPERCRGAERSSSARTFSTCVFTDEAYTKYYGASVTFYELYKNPLSDQQKEKLDLGIEEQSPSISSLKNDEKQQQSADDDDKAKDTLYYCNKAICLVSRYPFFEPFRRFLFFLLNTVTVGESRIPIERYISHLMYEVPFPSPSRPRILMELGSDMVAFESSDDSQIPLTGASFLETLNCLGTECFLYAMLLTLLEQKILVHSLRPWLLASVTETFCALIFPFSWQLPYIPQCPLEVADIFHAPLSFMAGVDSRYFDLKEEPPSDVTCFDLDTAIISKSTVRKFYKLDMLPKKPLKRLRAALDGIYLRNSGEKGGTKQHKDSDQVHLRRMQSELAIREAFLKFICAIMDGYADYLCPLMQCPQPDQLTEMQHLFDWTLFIQSRDKSSIDFYQKFRETTCFIRFIEERSGALTADRNGIVDRSTYYVFFDDCIARLNAVQNSPKEKSTLKEELNSLRLLDCDSMRANRTVVVQQPQVMRAELADGRTFHYGSFPQRFNDDLFEREEIVRAREARPAQKAGEQPHLTDRKNYHILRTRQEIRKSLADCMALAEQNALYWPRSVLFYAYSIWFMQLPSLMVAARNKRKILLLGLRVLSRMEQLGLPFHDQVCYRLLMQLCGEYCRPEMAVQILRKMLRMGVVPNAITYKIYHQALIESEWPSEKRRKAIDTWRRLQVCLEVCARFRSQLLPRVKLMEVVEPAQPQPVPAMLNSLKGSEPKLANNSDQLEQSVSDESPSASSTREIDPADVKDGSNMSQKSFRMFAQKFWSPKYSAAFAKTTAKVSPSTLLSPNHFLGNGLRGAGRLLGLLDGQRASVGGRIPLLGLIRNGFDTLMSPDQSGLSTLSNSNEDLLGVNGDYFFLCTKRAKDLLSINYWMQDILPEDDAELRDVWLRRDGQEEDGTGTSFSQEEFLDVLICSTTVCANCEQLVYDDELTLGWSIDDGNLNSTCPHCQHSFSPSLKVCIRVKPQQQQQQLDGPMSDESANNSSFIQPSTSGKIVQAFTVPYVNPLVLRRELENLLASEGPLILSRPSMRISHPIMFWNIFYYCRRLELPTHLLTWVSPAVVIHCVSNMPTLPGEVEQQQKGVEKEEKLEQEQKELEVDQNKLEQEQNELEKGQKELGTEQNELEKDRR